MAEDYPTSELWVGSLLEQTTADDVRAVFSR